MKTAVTIEVDTDALRNVTDAHLVNLWHVAQANPAPMEDRDAGRLAEHIGREIIRRFIAERDPELWARQGSHAWFCEALTLRERAAAGEPAQAAAPAPAADAAEDARGLFAMADYFQTVANIARNAAGPAKPDAAGGEA